MDNEHQDHNHKKHDHSDQEARLEKVGDNTLIIKVEGMVCAFCAQGIIQLVMTEHWRMITHEPSRPFERNGVGMSSWEGK